MRHDLRDQSRDPAKVNHKQAPSLPVGRYCLHPNLTSGSFQTECQNRVVRAVSYSPLVLVLDSNLTPGPL